MELRDDGVDYHAAKADNVMISLEVIQLHTRIQFLEADNAQLRKYIEDSFDMPKRSRSQLARDRMKFYHEAKDAIISSGTVNKDAPWHVIKKQTDELFDKKQLIKPTITYAGNDSPCGV